MSMNLAETFSAKESSAKEGANKGCNVQVAVRCRPMNADERKNGQASVITCDVENKAIRVAYGPAGKKIMKSFTFDKVFGMYSRQEEVFDSVVRPIVEETLAGFNCTIFAYGQTGTGKTHTMEGNINSPEDAGIVPRSVNAILQQLESSGAEFTIRVSFLELYNEELADLLNTSGDKKLKLCEDVKKGVVCQNLEEIAVLNASDIFEILQRGIQQRSVAATLCNKNSSRSHSIFTMKIMIKECNVEGEEVVRHGQLNLVDLAGSECIGRSGAKNDRAREAGSINQSLLTLGRVITALVDHHGHIPYRDSKLTRLLQESLGGKAKTCIIATFSPAQAAVEETMSTLDYAYRAKSIKNQPTVNQKLTKKVIMKEYFAEIETLRAQLTLTREKSGVYLSPEDFYAMESRISSQEAQLTECEAALREREKETKALREENTRLSTQLSETETALSESRAALAESERERERVCVQRERLFAQWQASERVIAEQRTTERSLTTSLQSLSAQLGECERERERLLYKVQQLEAAEQTRFSLTNAFLDRLHAQRESLTQRVSALTEESASHSERASESVSVMLQRGKELCERVQSALCDAMTTLTEETKRERERVTERCEDLSQSLVAQSERERERLGELSQSVSLWASDVERELCAQRETCERERALCASLSQSVSQSHSECVVECERYTTTQRELSERVHAQAEAITTRAHNDGAAWLSQCEAQRESDERALAERVAHTEKEISRLLSQLVHTERERLRERESERALYVRAQSEALQRERDALLSVCASQETEREKERERVLSLFAHTQQQTHTQCDALSALSQAVSERASAVSEALVGHKRRCESHTESVCEDMLRENKRVRAELRESAENTCAALLSVDKRTTDTQARVAECVREGESSLSTHADTLTQTVSAHRESVQHACAAHKETLGEIRSESVCYSERNENARCVAVGDTPRKPRPQPHNAQTLAVPATRRHSLIRREVLTHTQALTTEPHNTQVFSEEEIAATLEEAERVLSLSAEEVWEGPANASEEVHRDPLERSIGLAENKIAAAEEAVEEADSENVPPQNNISGSAVEQQKNVPPAKVTTRRSGSRLARTRSGLSAADI